MPTDSTLPISSITLSKNSGYVEGETVIVAFTGLDQGSGLKTIHTALISGVRSESEAKSDPNRWNNSYQSVQNGATRIATAPFYLEYLAEDNNQNVESLHKLLIPTWVPNDPYYPTIDLWSLKIINIEEAWAQTTGSEQIVVADIDTGIDRNHEDIKDNMWVNVNEIANNGIDDDQNGYIDDYYGWDWVKCEQFGTDGVCTKTKSEDNDPIDDAGHGTHTAGTIAATGNNGLGVVGVNWKSKIIALKFLSLLTSVIKFSLSFIISSERFLTA